MEDQISKRKHELRREFLNKRRSLDPEVVDRWSDMVQMHILGSSAFNSAGLLASYAAFDNEVMLDRVFHEARKREKEVAFPRMGLAEGEMDFFLVEDLGEMKANRFGIYEPTGGTEPVKVKDIDLVLVPGVAYDPEGWRLGMGGGYYDRLISRIRSTGVSGNGERIMGIAYSIQVALDLPHDDLDQRMDLVVTEKGFCSSSMRGFGLSS